MALRTVKVHCFMGSSAKFSNLQCSELRKRSYQINTAKWSADAWKHLAYVRLSPPAWDVLNAALLLEESFLCKVTVGHTPPPIPAYSAAAGRNMRPIRGGKPLIYLLAWPENWHDSPRIPPRSKLCFRLSCQKATRGSVT
jgi:hypothetical protein